MAKFTLDDIRTAAEKEYGSTEIEFEHGIVELVNALRLPKKLRDELQAVQEKFGDDDADTGDLLAKSLLLVAKDKTIAKKFLDTIGDDLAVLLKVFESYNEKTQAGEA